MSLTSASPLAAPGRSSPPVPSGRPLAGLSDDEVLRGLGRLLAQSRRVESELVAHIAEVDHRRLWAREAFPSMFAYCTGALRLSESEAYLRIAVGRASRAHPAVLRLLTEGRAHLSGIALLAPHLTPENAESLLARAAFKSKREIEELLASIAPGPDVPAALQRLPARAASIAAPPTEIVDGRASSVGTLPVEAVSAPSAVSTDSPAAAPPATLSGMGRTVTPERLPDAPDSSRLSVQTPPPRPVQPLAPDRYKVQFTATGALVRKLERLCALMGSRFPGGDLSAVIDAVVSEKLERIEARRFGAKPRSAAAEKAETKYGAADTNGVSGARRSAGTRSAVCRAVPTNGGSAAAPRAPAPPTSRHVPARIRRAVFDRDGGRCTYVDASGRRCPELDRLEYHHRHPFGVAGSHGPENLRLMCRAHNMVEAEHDFGRRTMDRYRRSDAKDSRPPPLADHGSRRSGPATAVARGATASPRQRPAHATVSSPDGRSNRSPTVASAPAGARLPATAALALDSPTR